MNMSNLLQKHKDFLTLLLTTDNLQARALLDTLTTNQVYVLSEIAYNILLMKHSKAILEKLKKHNHILKKLSNKKLTAYTKKKLLSKYRKQTLILLHLFKKQLLQLL